MEMYNPSHPGDVLKDLFLNENNISISEFALKAGMPRAEAEALLNCEKNITADIALRLAKAFNTSPEMRLNLQQAYDLWQAKQRVNLDDIVPIDVQAM